MNNKTLTKALLSATILASGAVGAGSVIAQASDGDAATTSSVAVSDSAAPIALQTIDDQPDDVGTTTRPPTRPPTRSANAAAEDVAATSQWPKHSG
jgi:hypothetical protein